MFKNFKRISCAVLAGMLLFGTAVSAMASDLPEETIKENTEEIVEKESLEEASKENESVPQAASEEVLEDSEEEQGIARDGITELKLGEEYGPLEKNIQYRFIFKPTYYTRYQIYLSGEDGVAAVYDVNGQKVAILEQVFKNTNLHDEYYIEVIAKSDNQTVSVRSVPKVKELSISTGDVTEVTRTTLNASMVYNIPEDFAGYYQYGLIAEKTADIPGGDEYFFCGDNVLSPVYQKRALLSGRVNLSPNTVYRYYGFIYVPSTGEFYYGDEKQFTSPKEGYASLLVNQPGEEVLMDEDENWYQFVPETMGIYQAGLTNSGYTEVYDENMNQVGSEVFKGVAGQRYYIYAFATADNNRVLIQTDEQLPMIQADTATAALDAYVEKWFKFAPGKGTFNASLSQNRGSIKVYDSDMNQIASRGQNFKTEAEKTYYVVINSTRAGQTALISTIIVPELSITSQPKSCTVIPGGQATLSLEAAVTIPGTAIHYQWYVNDTESYEGATPVEGAVENTYAPETWEAGKKYYFCKVSAQDAEDVDSEIVYVKVKHETLITPTSRTAESGGTVAPVSGGGVVYEGDTVTLVAQEAAGYSFMGWYRSINGGPEEKLSETSLTLVDSRPVEATDETIAYFAEYHLDSSIAVQVEAKNFYYGEDGKTAVFYEDGFTKYYEKPTDIQIQYKNDEGDFVVWNNGSDKVVSVHPGFAATVVSDITFKVVTSESGAEKQARVIFASVTNQLLKTTIVKESTTEEEVVFPKVPYRAGMKSIGWDKTFNDLIQAVENGEKVITVKPIYEEIGIKNNLTLQPVITTSADPTDSSVWTLAGAPKQIEVDLSNLNRIKEAETLGEKAFVAYVSKDYQVISYDLEMGIQIADNNQTIYVVYGDEAPAKEPTVYMSGAQVKKKEDAEKYTFTFFISHNVPEGCTLIQQGVLYGTNPAILAGKDAIVPETAEEQLKLKSKDAYEFISGSTDAVGNITLNVNGIKSSVMKVFARGYLVYKDANGTMKTKYTTIASGSYAEGMNY